MNDTKIGVITSGIPYQYVKEALPEASVLKLGMVIRFQESMIEEFASKVDTLYVVEELDPVIETQVKSWGIKAIGKEIFTVQGEYSANMLREAILKEELDISKPAQAPGRPPILCPGCPHRGVYYVLNKLKIHAAGDIGCYTLGAVAPLSVVDTTICMGASISSLHGIEKGKKEKEYIKYEEEFCEKNSLMEKNFPTKYVRQKLAIQELMEENNCSVAAFECWSAFPTLMGLCPCVVLGEMADNGMPLSCETDINGAITLAILRACNLFEESEFLADLTIRHPQNDNAELFMALRSISLFFEKRWGRGKISRWTRTL